MENGENHCKGAVRKPWLRVNNAALIEEQKEAAECHSESGSKGSADVRHALVRSLLANKHTHSFPATKLLTLRS